MRQLVGCAVVVMASAACRQTGDSASQVVTAGARDVVIPLHPYFRDLRVVRALAGTDTLTLLLDTGGGTTLITPQVAARRDCVPHGLDVGHRMTGEPVAFARCDSLRITSGAWSVNLVPVAVFDVSALLPKELPALDGVLSLDAFRGHVVTVDWPAGSLTIRGSATEDSAVADNGVTARLATGESGRFLTALLRVEGSREPLWFLLDSGNLRGTLVAMTVLRDSLLRRSGPKEAMLAIGGRRPIRFTFTAANLVLDGALGTDYLERGPVTLDLRSVRP
jgi:hypothetical protein